MLTEVYSSILGNSTPIHFYEGLNIIQGLEGNSIGKSSMLKIIDFAFGGKYYTDSNADILDHKGHHDICFQHQFGTQKYYFKRNTKKPTTVIICNKEYEDISEQPTADFSAFLKDQNRLNNLPLSFRQIVSLYIRIWNKANKEVNRPLYEFSGQTVPDAILNLIKTFNQYSSISELQQVNRYIEKKISTMKTAAFYEIIDFPTNKKTYTDNKKQIESIDKEIAQFVKYFNIEAQDNQLNISNQSELLLLERGDLLQKKGQCSRELLRIKKNLTQNESVQASTFSQLHEFFPTVNIKKLSTIQGFHSTISTILANELQMRQTEVEQEIQSIENQVKLLDHQIENSLGTPSKSSTALPHILNLLGEKQKLVQMNYHYDERQTNQKKKKENREQLDEIMISITEDISREINKKIEDFSKKITGNNSKPPVLQLNPQTYNYGVPDNTGTGKAYTDLILFDLSILSLTQLPILIHDSFLFNNIEPKTIGSFIKLYSQFTDKQVFISLDQYYRFDNEIDEIIDSSIRIHLSNTRLLYGKDWRT